MVQEANSISIIMVTYNSSSKLRTFFNKVLESLSLQRQYLNGDVEMIAVDNNSKDNTSQILRESGLFDKIIINHRNVGLPAGYNIGFAVSSGRYVFFMNDDIIVLPNSLKKMMNILRLNQSLGAVQPIIMHLDGTLEVGFDMGLGGFVLPSRRTLTQLMRGNVTYADVIAGCCILVKREAFVGFEDELFWGYDDVDFSWRIRQRGYKVGIVRGAYVIHYGSATFGKENPLKVYLGIRNQLAIYLRNQHPLLIPLGLPLLLLEATKMTVWRISKGDYMTALFMLRALKDFRRLYRKLRKTSNRNTVNMTPIVDWQILS